MNLVPPKYRSITECQKDLLEGKITCSLLAEYYLERIRSTEALNIYIDVYEHSVREKSAHIDAMIAQGKSEQLGKLFGVFISHKDVICKQGEEVSAGSKILSGFKSLYTATGLQRILDQDAVLIGRVNCDEFAMGSSNENSAYGPTRNPHDPDLIPGGSSGASAASVAADTCMASLGSDTGGSVRQPASFCGVFGFKPSYGAISRYGLIAYGSSFDQIGFLSHSLDTCQALFQIARGKDPMDTTSIDVNPIGPPKEKLKLGYFKELDQKDFLTAPVQKVFKNFCTLVQSSGHELVEIELPLLDYLVPTYYILTTAEASSNLSRYDGIRYGPRAEKAQDINELYKQTRTEGFGREVKRRLMMGTYVLSAGYYDAYYNKAQQVRRLLIESLEKVFNQVDYLINPVTPNMPWPIGSMVDDPVQVYLTDIFTVFANLCGIPSISIPRGKDDHNVPIGIQISGKRKYDLDLLQDVMHISS